MKTGTPGFVPARLTEVRIARGLTKTAQYLVIIFELVIAYVNPAATVRAEFYEFASGFYSEKTIKLRIS